MTIYLVPKSVYDETQSDEQNIEKAVVTCFNMSEGNYIYLRGNAYIAQNFQVIKGE